MSALYEPPEGAIEILVVEDSPTQAARVRRLSSTRQSARST